MKHIITTCVLSLLVLGATARIAAERKPANLKPVANVFQNTRLQVNGDDLQFSNLPAKDMELLILDDQGIIEHTGVVTRKNNKISINNLPLGNHIIRLRQGVKVKVFGFLAEVVIKG